MTRAKTFCRQANYDIDTLDWQGDYGRSQGIFSSNLKSGSPSSRGFISLAHDIHDKTVHSFTAYMIDTLRAAGYTTALYGECMNDPPVNWYRNATTGQPYGGSIHNNAANSTAKSFTGSNATTTSVSHSTPSAVQGGERAFGNWTGNTTATGNATTTSTAKNQASSGVGTKLSTGDTVLGISLTWGLLWVFWS